MAVFTATDKGGGLYNFKHTASFNDILSIAINGSTAVVTVKVKGPDLVLTFTGTGFSANGTTPTGGTFTSVAIDLDGSLGTLTGIAPGALFTDITSPSALDHIFDGDDTLTGGAGNDSLYGGYGGNDTFIGNGGDDYLVVFGGTGLPTHTIDGGAGNDTLSLISNSDGTFPDFRNTTIVGIERFILSPDEGVMLNASQFGTGISLKAYFQSYDETDNGPPSTVEVFMDIAGPLDLRHLDLNGPQFLIHGSAADDTITATRGYDMVDGAGGNDLIVGGRAGDSLTGGTGSDTFDINKLKETGNAFWARDKITDFEHLVDRIDLSTIDANGGAKGNKAFKFLADEGAHFKHKPGQLAWHHVDKQTMTLVEGDVNGDAKVDFRIQLSGLLTLTGDDFVL